MNGTINVKSINNFFEMCYTNLYRPDQCLQCLCICIRITFFKKIKNIIGNISIWTKKCYNWILKIKKKKRIKKKIRSESDQIGFRFFQIFWIYDPNPIRSDQIGFFLFGSVHRSYKLLNRSDLNQIKFAVLVQTGFFSEHYIQWIVCNG